MHTHVNAAASGSLAPASASASEDQKLSPIRVKQRIAAVDAARGCAMLLVCLSHIKQHFVESAPALYSVLLLTTRIATPTFLLLSGFVIGHLLRGNARGQVGWLLVDRGLFLVLVAHFTLGLNELRDLSVFEWAFGRVMITDVIGIALCVAVLIRGASAAALFAAGICLYLLSWVIAMTLQVSSEPMRLLGSVLFHLHSAPNRLVDIALLPYLGVFLVGMGLSAYCREALQNRHSARLARRLATIGLLAIAGVLAGIAAWHFGKDSLPQWLYEPHEVSLLRASLHPGYKAPPSPAYLLLYGGVGLLLTALFFSSRPRSLLAGIADKAATIGRASLLCFIAQDWLLFLIPQIFGFANVTSVAFWFGYFALCVLMLFYASRQWIRIDGNRFFTIGLKHLVRRRQARAAGRKAPSRGWLTEQR